MPWFEWLFNVFMCLCCWGTLSLVARYLQTRKMWNDVMTSGCLLWVFGMRFRHPAAVIVPMVVFAIGLFMALDATRFNVPARVVAAAVGSLIWFQFIIWNLIAVMFYFCSGCFF